MGREATEDLTTRQKRLPRWWTPVVGRQERVRTSTEKSLPIGAVAAAVAGGVVIAVGSLLVGLFFLAILLSHEGLLDEPSSAENAVPDVEVARTLDF